MLHGALAPLKASLDCSSCVPPAGPRPCLPAGDSWEAGLAAAARFEAHPFTFTSWAAEAGGSPGPKEKAFRRQITRLDRGGTHLVDTVAGGAEAAALAVQELTDPDTLFEAERAAASGGDRWAGRGCRQGGQGRACSRVVFGGACKRAVAVSLRASNSLCQLSAHRPAGAPA